MKLVVRKLTNFCITNKYHGTKYLYHGTVSELSYAKSEDRSQATSFLLSVLLRLTEDRDVNVSVKPSRFNEHPVHHQALRQTVPCSSESFLRLTQRFRNGQNPNCTVFLGEFSDLPQGSGMDRKTIVTTRVVASSSSRTLTTSLPNTSNPCTTTQAMARWSCL